MTTIPDARIWQITPAKVEAAIDRIVETSKPLRLILFGSYVLGDTTANSDVDFLIVTSDDVSNPRNESVRIRRALRGISMPMDILVVPVSQWESLKGQPGMIYQEAHTRGKVVYES